MFKNIIKKNFQSYLVWVIFIIMFIFFSIASDKFLQISNFISILRNALIYGILACGMTFVLISGLVDLSIGSSVGFVGLIITILTLRGWGGIFGIIIIPLLVCFSISLANAIMIVRFKMPALIVTLAMLMVLKGIKLVIQIKSYTVLRDMPKILDFINNGYIWRIPISICIFIFLIILSNIILYKTPFGRKVIIVGANDHAAFLMGINPNTIKILTFLLLSIYVYFCSIILVGRIGGYSYTMGEDYEMVVLLAVIVGGTSFYGGRGSIIGSIGGVMVMSTLLDGLVLLKISYEWQKVILGIIFIFIIIIDRLYNRKNMYDLLSKKI